MIKSSFSAGINKFSDLTKEKLNQVMRGVAGEGLYDLHYEAESHVYTGWFRASWLVSVGRARDMVYTYRTRGFTAGHAYKGNRPRYKFNRKTGRMVHADERILPPDLPPQPGLGTITSADKIVFSNAVPYAERVALQFGYFRQTMEQLRKLVGTIATQVKNGKTFAPLSSYKGPR